MLDEVTRRISDKLRRELGSDVLAYLDDPNVIEIMLNPDSSLWIEKLGQPMEHVGEMAPIQAELLMATVATVLKTTIDAQNPILECELPLDGSRFEALLPPIVAAPVFTIRKKALKVYTLDEYVDQGVLTQGQRQRIGQGVRDRANILIVGGTGSGKTTLANAVIREIAEQCPSDRLICLKIRWSCNRLLIMQFRCGQPTMYQCDGFCRECCACGPTELLSVKSVTALPWIFSKHGTPAIRAGWQRFMQITRVRALSGLSNWLRRFIRRRRNR